MEQTEARLGVKLPPSYREFLKVTNGWRQTTAFIYKLWSTEEVNWYFVHHTDSINSAMFEYIPISDENYFVYDESQEPGLFRSEYLQTALEISDIGDSAIYLLNPQVVTPEGEWETWFFANWIPGAVRYRSFWEMMNAEYRSILE